MTLKKGISIDVIAEHRIPNCVVVEGSRNSLLESEPQLPGHVPVIDSQQPPNLVFGHHLGELIFDDLTPLLACHTVALLQRHLQHLVPHTGLEVGKDPLS